MHQFLTWTVVSVLSWTFIHADAAAADRPGRARPSPRPPAKTPHRPRVAPGRSPRPVVRDRAPKVGGKDRAAKHRPHRDHPRIRDFIIRHHRDRHHRDRHHHRRWHHRRWWRHRHLWRWRHGEADPAE
jgi:hypothetical protein